MKIFITLLAVIIGLLGIAAGAAKIALVPEEAEFLAQFGFTNSLTIAFGVLQAISGILLLIPGTRFVGATIAAAGFALSTILIIASGDLVFAGVSIVPLMLAIFIAYSSFSTQLKKSMSVDEV